MGGEKPRGIFLSGRSLYPYLKSKISFISSKPFNLTFLGFTFDIFLSHTFSKSPILLFTISHPLPHSSSSPSLMEDSLRKALSEKQAAVDAQGGAVRELKASGAPKDAIDAAVQELNALKLEKASIEKQLQAALTNGNDNALSRDAFRQALVNTLERRLFYIPSFKIYRGVAGLYDYGPPGCAVKSNVLAFWRQVNFSLISITILERKTCSFLGSSCKLNLVSFNYIVKSYSKRANNLGNGANSCGDSRCGCWARRRGGCLVCVCQNPTRETKVEWILGWSTDVDIL